MYVSATYVRVLDIFLDIIGEGEFSELFIYDQTESKPVSLLYSPFCDVMPYFRSIIRDQYREMFAVIKTIEGFLCEMGASTSIT